MTSDSEDGIAIYHSVIGKFLLLKGIFQSGIMNPITLKVTNNVSNVDHRMVLSSRRDHQLVCELGTN